MIHSVRRCALSYIYIPEICYVYRIKSNRTNNMNDVSLTKQLYRNNRSEFIHTVARMAQNAIRVRLPLLCPRRYSIYNFTSLLLRSVRCVCRRRFYFLHCFFFPYNFPSFLTSFILNFLSYCNHT